MNTQTTSSTLLPTYKYNQHPLVPFNDKELSTSFELKSFQTYQLIHRDYEHFPSGTGAGREWKTGDNSVGRQYDHPLHRSADQVLRGVSYGS